jgi:phospholipid/cholesterol/gamma-HCH transport system substrate-binding protein
MDGLKLTLPILNKTLESISELSQTSNGVMADSRKDIQAITGNINKLSLALIDTEKQLKGILGKVDVLGDSLKKADLAGAIHSLHRTTDELNQTVLALNKGQGTMGKLLKSDSLYRNLNASSASLNALLVDFKANPKRYVNFSVFGRKEKKAKETK